MDESSPQKKNPLGIQKNDLAGKNKEPVTAKDFVQQHEARYHEKNKRKERNTPWLGILFFLIMLGGIAYGAYWWMNRPEPKVERDYNYLVADKLLIPGQLLTDAERSRMGYSKAKWVEPKFVFYVIGQETGTKYAYEVEEKIFLYVPRNTVMGEDEFLTSHPLIEASDNQNDLQVIQGLMRFSTSGVYQSQSAPVIER